METVYTKKGNRPTIAGKRFAPREWNVGYRIGSTYEQMTKSPQCESDPIEFPGSESTRNSPRPHMRRAHWHHYWTGKGRTNYEARWIPPISVNTKDISTQIPVVQHDVKGSALK